MTLQRPAYEEVTFDLGGSGRPATLRPTLRAAVHLERLHDGFPALFRRVDEFHFGTISEIILSCSRSRQDAAAFLTLRAGKPLLPFMLAVREPLTQLLRSFVPAPEKPSGKPTGNPMPWADYYRELYRTATGWLGWTPEVAWNATPTEINEAAAGKFAMLRAIHGSGEDDKPGHDPLAPVPPEKVREGITRLRSLSGKGR